MKKFWWTLFLPLALLLGWVKPALAGDLTPVEGRDYWILPQAQCEGGTCVRIAPGININTPLLAEKLGVKPIDIRRDNPAGTIACCRIEGTKNQYRTGRLSRALEDRTSDVIWQSCPKPEDQYVYVLPGQIIKITGIKHLSFQEETQLQAEIKKCTTPECATEVARKWGAKIPGNASATAPVQGADPRVAELTACTTEECTVAVAIKYGANIVIKPPSDGDKLLAELKACGADDACRNKALQAHNQKPFNQAAAQSPTTAPTVVSEMPVWARWLIGSLGIIALAFIVLYFRLGSKMVGIIRERIQEIQENNDTTIDGLNGRIEGLQRKFDAQALLLKNRAEEVASRDNILAGLRVGFEEFSKKESVPIPQGASTSDVWNLVSQCFSGLARENGELRENQRRLELSNAGAEAALQFQVEANEKLAADFVTRNEELRIAKSSLDDERRNRERLAELHGLLAPLDRELILVDNELTGLAGPYQAKLEEYQALEVAGDSQAQVARTEIVSIETRVSQLNGRRQDLAAESNPWRVEFNSLFNRLNGFGLNDVPLYEEAQRDRNDAAKELGKAKAIFVLAEARREQESIRSQEREQALEAKVDELVARECTVTDRERQVSQREVASDAFDLQIKQREDRVAKLETAGQSVNARLVSEVARLTAKVEELNGQLDNSDLRIVELQDELDTTLLQMVKAPSSVPVFLPVTAPAAPLRPTMPYSDPAVRLVSTGDAFFNALAAILSASAPIVVDTAQEVWLLYDFLTQFRIDIRLEELFPDGPVNNYSDASWEKQCDKFRRATVEKVSFVVEELALKPPQGYTPLALASGS